MLQYIKRLDATLNKLYTKAQYKMISAGLDRLEKNIASEKKA